MIDRCQRTYSVRCPTTCFVVSPLPFVLFIEVFDVKLQVHVKQHTSQFRSFRGLDFPSVRNRHHKQYSRKLTSPPTEHTIPNSSPHLIYNAPILHPLHNLRCLLRSPRRFRRARPQKTHHRPLPNSELVNSRTVPTHTQRCTPHHVIDASEAGAEDSRWVVGRGDDHV